jgi:AraC-like DNA-binding protein
MTSSKTISPHPRPDRAAEDAGIPSLLVGGVIAYTRARGGDADGLIQRFGLAPTVESDPLAVIAWPDLIALLDAAEIEARDPALGVHVAEHARRSSAAVMEFACSGVPDLRAALDRYARYLGRWNPQLTITVEKKGSGAIVRQVVPGRSLGLGPQGNEHWVALMLVTGRRVTGAACLAERVVLAHPAKEIHPEMVRIAGTSRIETGAGYNAIELSGELLDTPLSVSPTPMSSLLSRYASFAAAERPVSGPLDGSVREAIREALPSGIPTVDVVARRLGTSSRTLQRQLASEGISFLGLVDGLRHDLARAYAEASKLSVDEMAGRLGYAQTSAFLRAFKRWTGTTPRRLRGGGSERP